MTNWLKPTKDSLRITFNYLIFLIFLNSFVLFIGFYFIREPFFSYWLDRGLVQVVLIIFFFGLFCLVYISGQLLSLWLCRYQSKVGRWLVTSTGAVLSLLTLVFVFYAWDDTTPNHNNTRIVSNVKQLQTACELYYNDAGKYPEKITPGGKISYGNYVYFSDVPEIFINTTNTKVCPKGTIFSYEPTADRQSYTIRYCITEETGKIPAGINIATEKTISLRAIRD